jgi:hypothetical protein
LRDIPFDLQTQVFKPTTNTKTLTEIAKVDVRRLHFQKSNGRNNDKIIAVSGVFDRNGDLISGVQKTIQLQLRDETLTAQNGAGNLLTDQLRFDSRQIRAAPGCEGQAGADGLGA